MTNSIKTTEHKPMPKWLIYGLFILKFLLGLYLIYWTVYMTMQTDTGKDVDNAFLSTYHKVDSNFNNIVVQNKQFEEKYNIKFKFNDEEIIGLSYDDIFLSQRGIKQRDIRKNILKVGTNKFTVLVQDKQGNKVESKTIEMLITKAINHLEDVKLSYKNEDTKEFEIKSMGYWNITGKVKVGDEIGSFYIKTNAKQ